MAVQTAQSMEASFDRTAVDFCDSERQLVTDDLAVDSREAPPGRGVRMRACDLALEAIPQDSLADVEPFTYTVVTAADAPLPRWRI
jgi:hypothetical protein